MMKNIFMTLLSLFLGVGIVHAAVFEKEVKSRGTTVRLSSDKPLTAGSNTLILLVSKETKVPEGAKVSVKAFMPAMPGMPAMESVTEGKDLGKGRYEVRLNLSMRGTWQLHIFITPTVGKRSRVKTSLSF